MADRFNDYIQSIGGTEEEEPKLRGIDLVKSMLKGAALTTVAGAVGGTDAMRAVGGYADLQEKKKAQRKLDKINRAKNMLAAERDIASIKASEASIERGKEDLADRKRNRFLAQVQNTEKEQAGLRKFQAEQKTKQQKNAVDMAKLTLGTAFGGKMGSSRAAGSSGQGKDPKVPTLITTPRPVSGDEAEATEIGKIASKNDQEIMDYAAGVASQFRRVGATADDVANNWPVIVRDQELFRLREEDQEKIRNRIVQELSSSSKLAAQAKMKTEGGLQTPNPGTGAAEKIADKAPNIGPALTGAATGFYAGGGFTPVGVPLAILGGLAGYAAGNQMDPNVPMTDYLPGGKAIREGVGNVASDVSGAVGNVASSVGQDIIRPAIPMVKSAKESVEDRVARIKALLMSSPRQLGFNPRPARQIY